MPESLSSTRVALGFLFVLILGNSVSSSPVEPSNDEAKQPAALEFNPPISFSQFGNPSCAGRPVIRGYIATITKLGEGSFCIRPDPSSSISSRLDVTGCGFDKIYEDSYTCTDPDCNECTLAYKTHTGWASVRPKPLVGHCYDYKYARAYDPDFLEAYRVNYSFDSTSDPLDTSLYTNFIEDNSCIAEGRPALTFDPPIPFTQYFSKDCTPETAVQRGELLSIKQMEQYGSYCSAAKFSATEAIQFTRADIVGCSADGIYKEFYDCADPDCLECDPVSKSKNGWDGVDPDPTVGFCYDSVHTSNPLDQDQDNEESSSATDEDSLGVGFSFDPEANPEDAKMYMKVANGNSCIEDGQPTHPNTVEVTNKISCEAMVHSHKWAGTCCSLSATSDGGCALTLSSNGYCTVHGPVWNKDYSLVKSMKDLVANDVCPPSEFEIHQMPTLPAMPSDSHDYRGWFRFHEGTDRVASQEPAGLAPPGLRGQESDSSELPKCSFKDQGVAFNHGSTFAALTETLVVDGCLLDCKGIILRADAAMSSIVAIRNGGHVKNCSVALYLTDEWSEAYTMPPIPDGEGRFLEEGMPPLGGEGGEYVPPADNGFGGTQPITDDDWDSINWDFEQGNYGDYGNSNNWVTNLDLPVSGFSCDGGDCLIEDSRCTIVPIDEPEADPPIIVYPIFSECVLVAPGAADVRIEGGLDPDSSQAISTNGIVVDAAAGGREEKATRARLFVERATIGHQLLHGIDVRGGATSVRLSDVVVAHNKEDGIRVGWEDESLSVFAILGGAVTDNGLAGITIKKLENDFGIDEDSNLRVFLSDVLVGDNVMAGLHVDHLGADLAIDESIFESNGYHGIEIENATTVAIQGIQCKHNAKDGANIQNVPTVDVTNSIFVFNKDGIDVTAAENLTITNSVFNHNRYSGIDAWDISKLTISGVDAMKNLGGIHVNRYGWSSTADSTNQTSVGLADVRTCKNSAVGLGFSLDKEDIILTGATNVVTCKNRRYDYREVINDMAGTLAIDPGISLVGERCQNNDDFRSCFEMNPLLWQQGCFGQCKGHRKVVTKAGTITEYHKIK